MALQREIIRYQWTPARRERSAPLGNLDNGPPSVACSPDRLHSRESAGGTPTGAFPEAPRFLCDEMLGRLARYLRAAGYDTALASGGAPDQVWLAVAQREHRILLTCDRAIAARSGRAHVLALRQGSLDEQATALSEGLAIDWLWRPFTRCLVDNTCLLPAGDDLQPQVPVALRGRALRSCPRCGRLYWAGSHHRRMRARLASWHSGSPGGGRTAKLPPLV